MGIEISIGLAHLSILFGILGILVSGVAVSITLGIREDEKDRRMEVSREKILEKEHFIVGMITRLQKINMTCIAYEQWLKKNVSEDSKPHNTNDRKQALESLRKAILSDFTYFWDFFMTKNYLLDLHMSEHLVSLKRYIEEYLDIYPDIYNLHPISQIAYKLRNETYPLFKNVTISNSGLKNQQELMVDYLRWTYEINEQKGKEALNNKSQKKSKQTMD